MKRLQRRFFCTCWMLWRSIRFQVNIFSHSCYPCPSLSLTLWVSYRSWHFVVMPWLHIWLQARYVYLLLLYRRMQLLLILWSGIVNAAKWSLSKLLREVATIKYSDFIGLCPSLSQTVRCLRYKVTPIRCREYTVSYVSVCAKVVSWNSGHETFAGFLSVARAGLAEPLTHSWSVLNGVCSHAYAY